MEHFLNSNLVRRRDRLNAELSQVEQEDRSQKLEISKAELDTVNQRISENDSRFSGSQITHMNIFILVNCALAT